MDPIFILSFLMLVGAAFMHARMLRRTLREQRAKLEEARLALGNARRLADEAELSRRQALKALEGRMADVIGIEKTVEDLEQRFAELKKKPARRHFVLDRQPPRHMPIWEVSIHAREAAAVPEATRLSWTVGRSYLVTALSSQEAVLRCAAKFPPNAGFDLGDAQPFHPGGSASGFRPRVVGRRSVDPPAYDPTHDGAQPGDAAPAQGAA